MATEHRTLRNAMLKLLFEQGKVSQRSSALSGLIIVAALWTVAPTGLLITWFVLLASASIARLFLIRHFQAAADDRQDLERYAQLFLVGVIISGIIWGAVPYLVYPAFPMPQMLVVILVLLGIAAGAALSLPASRWYFLAFAIPELTPMAVRFMEQGGPVFVILAIATFVIILGFHLASLDHYNFMKKMTALAINNADLAGRLQQTNIDLTVEMSRHQEYEKSVRERDNALQHLNDLVTDVDSEFQRRLENMLQFGCRLFHMESGAVARIDGNQYEIRAAASATGPVHEKAGLLLDTRDTVCANTIVSTNPVFFSSPEEAGELVHPDMRNDFGSYIGMMLQIDDKAWGTLNFYSSRHRAQEFSTGDMDFLRLMTSWVQNSIELNKWKTESQNLEREKQIVFDALPMYVAHLDMQQQYTYVNRRYVEHFSKERRSIEGQHIRDVIGDDNYELVKPYLQAALNGEYCSFEIRPFDQVTGERSERSMVIQYIPNHTPDNEQDGCFALTMDVTPDDETKTMLAAIAERDMLTGLVARPSFMEQLEQLLADKRSQLQEHSICVMDIDDFAKINSQSGQLVGDDVLRRIAEMVRARKRTSDLFARLGGDNFALLLPDCPLSKSKVICRDICHAVQAMDFTLGQHKIPVTISIGVISFPGTIDDRDYLLQQAGAVLEQAKKSGKNRVKSKQTSEGHAENKLA